jgi:hypothetical protein
MKLRRNLTRIHLWLGWLIGIPLLFWTISGLWMVARPIEEVRGEQLKADPPLLVLESAPVFPAINGKVRATDNAKLIRQGNQPVWIINFHDKGVRRASAIDRPRLISAKHGLAGRRYSPTVRMSISMRTAESFSRYVRVNGASMTGSGGCTSWI